MRRLLIAGALFTMLALPAFAQESSILCHRETAYSGSVHATIYTEDATVCTHYPGGRVNVIVIEDTYSRTDWYTARQWKLEKSKWANLEAELERRMATLRVEGEKFRAELAKKKAEADAKRQAEMEAADSKIPKGKDGAPCVVGVPCE